MNTFAVTVQCDDEDAGMSIQTFQIPAPNEHLAQQGAFEKAMTNGFRVLRFMGNPVIV